VYLTFAADSVDAVFRISPVHILDVIKGQENIPDVLANRKRVGSPAWYKSSG